MAVPDPKFQQEVRKIWKTTRQRLNVLGDEAVQLARRGEEELARATRVGTLQLGVLNAKRRLDRVYAEIGRRVMDLTLKGRADVPGIRPQLKRAAALSRQIRVQEVALTRARKNRSARRRRRR